MMIISIKTEEERQALAQRTYEDIQKKRQEKQKKAKQDANGVEFDNWNRIVKRSRRKGQ